jgi:hypothetical protein
MVHQVTVHITAQASSNTVQVDLTLRPRQSLRTARPQRLPPVTRRIVHQVTVHMTAQADHTMVRIMVPVTQAAPNTVRADHTTGHNMVPVTPVGRNMGQAIRVFLLSPPKSRRRRSSYIAPAIAQRTQQFFLVELVIVARFLANATVHFRDILFIYFRTLASLETVRPFRWREKKEVILATIT